MSDSTNRTDKGPPPTSSPPSEPASNETSVWDNPDLNTDAPLQSTDADLALPSLNPKSSGSDNQPTVISRTPLRSNDDVMNSLRGRRLAHFELIAPIGVGGMAAVIKGRDLQLDRTVALKILPPDMASDPENVRRFHHEARAAAKLDHENIARVFYYGEDQRLHFIAFEFVQGDNLRAIVERRGRLPVGEAVHYILQVATGLAHAASRGVVHRDIKPSNIIITPNGRAKLVDMGLARSLIPQDDKQLTQSGVTLGTFDYISPEQAMEPREADVRSDIYSLGCTFYHVLTGQPPVPEGTAAKKLHHHQHELPIDPRQLNPDIPDEVAAILGKMMAKNPRNRYQKAEQLVEQLLNVAQKLDSGSERPDGLLYVDAPLPTSPTRPLFLVALAIAAVVALIFALDQPTKQKPYVPAKIPSTGSKGQPDNKTAGEAPRDKAADKSEQPRDPAPGPNGANPEEFVYSGEMGVKELRKWAAELEHPTSGDLKVIVHKDLDLTGVEPIEKSVGILLRGRKIEFVAAPGMKNRPTVWLRYDGKNSLTTALQFVAEEVKLTGVRFVINASESVRMTAVLLLGGSEHLVRDCQFIQRLPNPERSIPMESVVLDKSEPSRGVVSGERDLTLRECAFLGEEGPAKTVEERLQLERIGAGGRQAIVRRGPGTIEARNCVFGPHQACFSLEGRSKADEEEDLELIHCSVMLADGSAVFHLEREAGTHARVEYCLFSRPEERKPPASPLSAGAAALLIRHDSLAGSGRSQSVIYRGLDNRYHKLEGFWGDLRDDSILAGSWTQFLSRLELTGGGSSHESTSSRTLATSPWESSTPLETLQRLDFVRAFRVKQNVRDLRVSANPEAGLIGAESCDGEHYNDGPLPRLEDDPPRETVRKPKVFDPTIAQSENGHYKTLIGALEEAQQGDTILVRYNGRLALNPLILEKAVPNVTIRPDRDYRPILTLKTDNKDAALFRLHEGTLKFQGLDIELAPSQKEFEAQSVVHLAGDAEVRFENCTITLGEPLGSQLAVVSLGDPGALRRPPLKPGQIVPAGPTVEFERCFIRGKGDLLWCKASRPFQLKASYTLATLAGSLVLMNGSDYAKSLPGPGGTEPGPRCVVTLKHVTTALSAPLIHLRASRDIKSLLPVKVQPSDCLFAPLGSRTMVGLYDLEPQPTEMEVKERILWGGDGGNNAYGPFASFMEIQVIGRTMMMPRKSFDRDHKDYTGETESKFLEAVPFQEAIDSTALHRTRPEQFTVASLMEFGAKIADLPTPNPHRDEGK